MCRGVSLSNAMPRADNRMLAGAPLDEGASGRSYSRPAANGAGGRNQPSTMAFSASVASTGASTVFTLRRGKNQQSTQASATANPVRDCHRSRRLHRQCCMPPTCVRFRNQGSQQVARNEKIRFGDTSRRVADHWISGVAGLFLLFPDGFRGFANSSSFTGPASRSS